MRLAALDASTLLVALVIGATERCCVMADLPPSGARGRYTASSHGDHTSSFLDLFPLEADAREAAEQMLQGAAASPWADHSPSERNQQLRLHLGERGKRYRAERRAGQQRRMQVQTGTAAGAQERDASIATYFNDDTAPVTEAVSCTDPLAANNGEPGGCRYDCGTLQDEFFPAGEESRCFIYDTATGTWPDELLNMRKQYLDVYSFLHNETGTNPPDEGVSFVVGEGRLCRNVTSKTSLLSTGEFHIEVLCLLDGEHEFNHTVTANHSVEVVGYAHSGEHTGAGGTTDFVIGECTDILLRVNTTTASAGPVTWRLDDGGHNGPWDFSVPAEIGVHEIESCMFDNEYTLVRRDGSGWQGSIEVVGFVHYHNTIEIPHGENWIIQGGIDASTGVQASLDARLSSGTPYTPSQSSIILRDMRFSGQTAPVYQHQEWLSAGLKGQGSRFGGAFMYIGGSDDPSNLPQLLFERVIFDHNFASTGSSIFIDGRSGTPKATDPSQSNWDSGISLTLRGCTLFRNKAEMGGNIFITDVWPHQIVQEDVDHIQNDALFMKHEFIYQAALTQPGGRRRTGESFLRQTRCHFDGGFSEGLFSVGHWAYAAYEGTDEPGVAYNFVLDGNTAVDHGNIVWAFFGMLGFLPPAPDLSVQFNVNMSNYSLSGSTMLTDADLLDSCFWSDTGHRSLIERSRFENNGPLTPGIKHQGVGGYAISRPKSVLPGHWPTVRFVNTEFIQNRGANGAAVGVIDGLVDLSFDSCTFRGNTATRTGGAIAFDATPPSRLLLERSFLDNNMVSIPQTDEDSTPATIAIFTGGLGDGAQDVFGSYHTPIWRIDDGPVYGVPWEMCEAAKQYSQEVVARGFPEVWPPDLQCANVTYNAQTAYSHIQLVKNGVHTLWHGAITQGALTVTTWLKGHIEIVGSVGPVFPTFHDYRQEHLEECNFSGTCGTPAQPEVPNCVGVQCCCARGVPLWSSTEFFVSDGDGGAIDVRGQLNLVISDTEFRNNDAPNGATMAIASAASVDLVGTTIDESSHEYIDAVSLKSASINRCAESPCEIGSRCYFRQFSRWCEPCRDNEVGDGLVCHACGAGTEPNHNQSICVLCDRPNEYSDAGKCKLCQGLVTQDRKTCADCPSHQVPIGTTGGCQCEPGRYDVGKGKIVCHQRNFNPDVWESTEYSVAREISASASENNGLSCAPCPSCVDCTLENDPPRIRAGFSMAGASVLSKDLETPGREKMVFQCRPETTIPNSIDQMVTAALGKGQPVGDDVVQCQGTKNATMICSEGHGGELCGECTTGYGRWHNNRCELCVDAVKMDKVIKLFLIAFVLVLVVGIGVIGLSFYVYDPETSDSAPLDESVSFENPLGDVESPGPGPTANRDVGGRITPAALFLTGKRLAKVAGHMTLHPLKIMISYWQVVAQMGNVLHFQFPETLDVLIRKMKWLVTGIQGMVATECLPGFNGYYRSWFLEVIVVPLLLLGAVLLYYLSRRATVGPAVALATARNEAFFIVFICYPSITNKVFAVLNCRTLVEGSSVLASDYSTPCGNDTHQLFVGFAWTIICLFSMGVPALLMIAMIKTRASERALFSSPEWNTTIQRMAALLEADDVDSVRSAVIDINQGKIYGNLISAYKAGSFLWEGIDMVRKLLIIGMLSLVSPGSTFQICIGILTGFLFFAGHVAIRPYRHWEDNVFKATTELHLFFMMVLVIALKTDLASEKMFSVTFYDTTVFVLWMILVPGAFFFCVWSKIRSVVEDDIAEHHVKPNRMAQMAFKRYQLGRDKDEDREILFNYITAMSQGDTADLQQAGLYHQPSETLCHNDANICADTLVCRGSYQSSIDSVTCAVKIRPAQSKACVVENLIRLECNHKNICGMINVIETSTSHYLILQLCVTSVRDAIDAGKLTAMIGDRTPLQVCGEIIDAIETLHSKKFVHGNLCPSNVLLDESGTPKLCGFSSASQLRDDGSATICTDRCRPGYLPPEMLDNERSQNGTVEANLPLAVDSFGLGCTIFTILSGEELFSGETTKAINAKVAAGDSRLDTLVSSSTAHNLIEGLVAADPEARTQVAASRFHPLFWTKQQAFQYLASVGGNLAVGITRKQDPFVADLEAAVDNLIGVYNEDEPSSGGSWAELLDSKYPIGGDWGKMQRAPAVDEHNYFIFGHPPKKKQAEARERLVAEGKPLGPHAAKEIRTVGLLKFVRNLNAHKAENVETGRFESEDAVANYILSSLPWLLMTVHTLDAKHRKLGQNEGASQDTSQEDEMLRMSFAANRSQ